MASLSDLIVTQQPDVTGAWASYPFDEKLAKRFRLMDKFDNPYILYKASNGKLFLPRAVCPMGVADARVMGQPADIPLILGPRDEEQDAAIVKMYGFFQDDKSGILQAGTGKGKTYIGIALAALMGVQTLVVVTKDDLFDQWVEAIRKFTGLPHDKIGKIRGPICNVVGKPISVAMIHSLSKDGKYPDYIKKLFGLTIYDECHRVAADSFMAVAGMFASKWRLGLSATTDRADGKQIVFQAHIGPTRVVIDGVPMVPNVYRYRTQYQLPRVPRWSSSKKRTEIVQLPHQAGKVGHVVSDMVKNEDRNQLIAKLAYMAWKGGKRVVLFSDQREHLDNLEGRLLALGVSASGMFQYVSGIKKQEKIDALSKSMLLCTYGMASEGTDFVDYDCVIMSTPRSDVRQPVGRVVRSKDGKDTPIVIDIIDDDSAVFRGYAEKRKTFYQSMEAKVVDVF